MLWYRAVALADFEDSLSLALSGQCPPTVVTDAICLLAVLRPPRDRSAYPCRHAEMIGACMRWRNVYAQPKTNRALTGIEWPRSSMRMPGVVAGRGRWFHDRGSKLAIWLRRRLRSGSCFWRAAMCLDKRRPLWGCGPQPQIERGCGPQPQNASAPAANQNRIFRDESRNPASRCGPGHTATRPKLIADAAYPPLSTLRSWPHPFRIPSTGIREAQTLAVQPL
jgi:hypothetical protein